MSEIAESENADNGIAFSEDFIESPPHRQAQTAAIDFDGLLNTPLYLHQDVASGNGGQAWPAGMVLAKYLLRSTAKKDALKNASIVELGAGSGLVGLAVAVGCRPDKHLHITDTAPMLQLMHKNIALNNLQDHVVASIYDWGQERPSNVPEPPDIVLAADCVYFEPAFPLLQKTLHDLIGPQTICYFCFKKRRRADQHFLKAIKKDFIVEDITDDPDRETYIRENIFLCTIRRKSER